jgi:hypothetical protein
MRDVYVVGVGMTPLGKHLDKRLRDLGRIACTEACVLRVNSSLNSRPPRCSSFRSTRVNRMRDRSLFSSGYWNIP